MATNKTISVKGTEITIFRQGDEDYISLTGIARHRDPERSDYILQNWLRNRNTIEFIGLWEQLNNPVFKSIEFDGFKSQAGANSFSLTPKRWIEATHAIGIVSKAGKMEAHLHTQILLLSLLHGSALNLNFILSLNLNVLRKKNKAVFRWNGTFNVYLQK